MKFSCVCYKWQRLHDEIVMNENCFVMKEDFEQNKSKNNDAHVTYRLKTFLIFQSSNNTRCILKFIEIRRVRKATIAWIQSIRHIFRHDEFFVTHEKTLVAIYMQKTIYWELQRQVLWDANSNKQSWYDRWYRCFNIYDCLHRLSSRSRAKVSNMRMIKKSSWQQKLMIDYHVVDFLSFWVTLWMSCWDLIESET